MRRFALLPAVLAGGALLPASASAEIVKAPTGESSSLTVNTATLTTFKKHKLKFGASGSAKAAGATLTMPYSLSRWDFGTREGDVAFYAKNTGFQLKRGKRKATAVHPRLVMDTPGAGYVSMLISNERIKFFTVSAVGSQASETGNVQQIKGYQLKLTQAGANYVNRSLKKKALKRFTKFGTLDVRLIRPASSAPGGGTPGTPGGGTPGQGDTPGGTVSIDPGLLDALPGGGQITPLIPAGGLDLDGDGNTDVGLGILPLEDAEFDLDTKTGTIKLGGGLVLVLPALGGRVELVNPEVVIGATDDGSALYAHINGVRVKVGDIDTENLDLNLLDGTVTVKQLHVTVGGALADLLRPVLGSALIQGETPLLKLDLSFPEI